MSPEHVLAPERVLSWLRLLYAGVYGCLALLFMQSIASPGEALWRLRAKGGAG